MKLFELFLNEMTNLRPKDTGLDLDVNLYGDITTHQPRVKVYKRDEVCSYSVLGDIKCMNGPKNLLSSREERNLKVWIAMNRAVIVQFTENKISTEPDLRSKLKSLQYQLPLTLQNDISSLCQCAPKVKEIFWIPDIYEMIFDHAHFPKVSKIKERLTELNKDVNFNFVYEPSQGSQLVYKNDH